MAYKPQTVSDTPISAKARVVKAKKGDEIKWQLTVSVRNSKTKTWETWDKPVLVDLKKAPPYLKGGDWSVRLTADKSRILSAVPDTATVTAVFKDIYHQEGKPYTPNVKQSTFGGEASDKPWVQFGFIYTVVDGDEYAGVEISDWLNYHFGPAPETYKGKKIVAYHPGGKNTEKLAARMEALGIWEYGPIEWDGEDITYGGAVIGKNILSVIAKRARKAARPVEDGGKGRRLLISLAGGEVASIKEVMDDDAIVEVSEDESAEGEDVGGDTEEVTEIEGETSGIVSEEMPEDDEIDFGDDSE